MGAWGIDPFENDDAADFADALAEAAPGDREGLIRDALIRTIGSRDCLEASDGMEAVAAAALVAAQLPGGEPVTTGLAPETALPVFAADLRTLAADALQRVLAEDSELAELWDDAEEGPRWRKSVSVLRAVLDPSLKPQEEVLFEM
jgi:hypothetical protein